MAAIPLMVVFLAVFSGRQRVGLAEVGRILASVAGVACVIAGGSGLRWGGQLAGDLLMLGAVVSTAGYVVLGGALTRRLDALTVTFVQLAWGAALFAPACAVELSGRGWPHLSGRGVAALAGLTVLASFAAFVCYNYVLAHCSATRAALWLNAVPVVTALAAWLLLGERLTVLELLGGGIVVTAVAVPSGSARAAGRMAVRDTR